MRSDLDAILRDRGIEALIVPMHEHAHCAFRWITRGAAVTRGVAIHVTGSGSPLLIHDSMERDEAKATGLTTRTFHELGWSDISRNAGSPAAAWTQLYENALRSLGVTGPVIFNGQAPLHLYPEVMESLESRGWTIARSAGEDLVQRARKTKDDFEAAEIESVGVRTVAIVREVREILRTAPIENGILLRAGAPITIGELKDFITASIHRRGLIEDHETILSQGRDAGVPHSRGNRSAPLVASQPIVLDIFPADRRSGYFFDYTRTFCPGPVPERLRSIHGDVMAAFNLATTSLRAGTLARDYQLLVCAHFEKNGHPTQMSDPATERGYVHGLGHGVGLEVHELPSFSTAERNRDTVEPGDVLTIEPGLYYPEESIGVRIEDTFLIGANGSARPIAGGDYALEP